MLRIGTASIFIWHDFNALIDRVVTSLRWTLESNKNFRDKI